MEEHRLDPNDANVRRAIAGAHSGETLRRPRLKSRDVETLEYRTCRGGNGPEIKELISYYWCRAGWKLYKLKQQENAVGAPLPLNPERENESI